MSFAAARQLVSPQAGAAPGGAVAPMPWESEEDESLARQDTWLLSFIDILALLLTLFVLLLAYQDEGADTAERADTSSVQFDWSMLVPGQDDAGVYFTRQSGPGLLPVDATGGYPMPSTGPAPEAVVPEAPAAPDTVELETVSTEPAADVVESLAEEPALAESAVVEELRPDLLYAEADFVGPPLPAPEERVQQVVAQSNLGQGVEVISEPGMVSLEISDRILFEPASAALSVEGELLLNEVALVLAELPYSLSVEGHSDNVPINSPRYPSNWELSSARAAMATRALIEFGVAADRLRAIGYGDTRPRSDNATPEGRSRNRRVTFVLEVDG